ARSWDRLPVATLMAQSYASLICPIIAGRARELAWFAPFLAGEGGPVLLVSGEAGIGKSRLIAEARIGATRDGTRVLRGACFEPDRGLPYAPLLDLLRILATDHVRDEAGSSLGPAAAEVRGLLTEAAGSPDALSPELSEPEQRKRRMFDALCDLFAGLSRTAPVLLIVEDLHWSDETSLEYLAYLARHLGDRPIRLLLTYRSDEPHPGLAHFVASLQRERLARELALARLSRDDAETMARAI